MASNPECRGTIDEWKEKFNGWIKSPTPKALMYCQIFFDSRPVMGEGRFYQTYREEIAKLANNDMFLGNLAILVNKIQVPLGLFNRLRTSDADGEDTIDIKRYGIALINDIARIYSLKEGLIVPGTVARLKALQKKSAAKLKRQPITARSMGVFDPAKTQSPTKSMGNKQA